MSRILSHFTRGMTPRDGQRRALQAVEAQWASADVHVITIPTGGGKSAVATTIARWAAKEHKARACITTPTNILLDQYKRANPKLVTLESREAYTCSSSREGATCAAITAELGHPCSRDCCYTKANRRIRAVPWSAVNTWTYLAHRLYPDVLICDEAHTLLAMVRDMASKKLWQHTYKYPPNLRTYSDLLHWVDEALDERPSDSKLRLLKADLTSGANRYLVEQGEEPYHGQLRRCLKLLPIDTSKEPPFLWPAGKVKKLVLMSATFSGPDLAQLGLIGKRVNWINTPSPIPPARRPVYVREPGFNLSRSATDEDLRAVAAEIDRLCQKHRTERGVIHATYALMDTLLPLLSVETRARVIAHSRQNKTAQFERFLSGPSDAVLLCAGMYEGVDLVGDLGRFQIISKVPWPSLGEPAWRWLAEADPERFGWEALRAVLQGVGRICRGPEDFGVTYVLDRSYKQLPEHLLPAWYKEAVYA